MKPTKLTKKIARRTPGLKGLASRLDTLVIDNGVLQLEKGNLEAELREVTQLSNSPREFLAKPLAKSPRIIL